jgi:hypothetical protein
VGVKRSNFRRSKQYIETIIDQEIETTILKNLSGDRKGGVGSRDRISGDQNSRSKLSLIRRSKLLQNVRRSKLPFLKNLSGDRKGPRGPQGARLG